MLHRVEMQYLSCSPACGIRNMQAPVEGINLQQGKKFDHNIQNGGHADMLFSFVCMIDKGTLMRPAKLPVSCCQMRGRCRSGRVALAYVWSHWMTAFTSLPTRVVMFEP